MNDTPERQTFYVLRYKEHAKPPYKPGRKDELLEFSATYVPLNRNHTDADADARGAFESNVYVQEVALLLNPSAYQECVEALKHVIHWHDQLTIDDARIAKQALAHAEARLGHPGAEAQTAAEATQVADRVLAEWRAAMSEVDDREFRWGSPLAKADLLQRITDALLAAREAP